MRQKHNGVANFISDSILYHMCINKYYTFVKLCFVMKRRITLKYDSF